MSWFAKDTFRNGGHLFWYPIIGPIGDKFAHFLAGAVLFLLGSHVAAPVSRFWIILALAFAWEVVELMRWIRWDKTGPWPPVTDQFSWRDIVAALAGALVAWGLTWR